jgi:hypothetical protein
MEFILLASMVFADGALSEQRGFILKSFPGFDPSRFDLFSHVSLVQSLSDLRYSLISSLYRPHPIKRDVPVKRDVPDSSFHF